MDIQCQPSKFNYIYSCDIPDRKFVVKICTLEGSQPSSITNVSFKGGHIRPFPELGLESEGCEFVVLAQLFSRNKALCYPCSTSHKYFSSEKRCNWNEWIEFPVEYEFLPSDAKIIFSVGEHHLSGFHVIGETSIDVFDENRMMRSGVHDLRVTVPPKDEQVILNADDERNFILGDTLSSIPQATMSDDAKTAALEVTRLEKVVHSYREGLVMKLDWLDRLAFREIERRLARQKILSHSLHFSVEFQNFHSNQQRFSIVYMEQGGDRISKYPFDPITCKLPDWEIGQENIVEARHHTLARIVRNDPQAATLKPTAEKRDLLNAVISYPPTKTLTGFETDLLWNYRYYVSRNKKALPKFLRTVNWQKPKEVLHALDLMQAWETIDVADALELLSGAAYCGHNAVRRYAVRRLRQAEDEDLLLYLLQLVQALRYEEFSVGALSPSGFSMHVRDVRGNNVLSGSVGDFADDTLDGGCVSGSIQGAPDSDMNLADFLITKGCESDIFANYLYWYLTVECDENTDARSSTLFNVVRTRFLRVLEQTSAGRAKKVILTTQQEFVNGLCDVMKKVSRENGSRKKKMEYLRTILQEGFSWLEGLPFPLDPNISVTNIKAEKAYLFSSSLMPARLVFNTVEGEEYHVIFKYGDDIRQDQLVLQTISLMDKLLLKENLDLHLTPYKALATTSQQQRHGFFQFVDSVALAKVLDSEGTILAFLRKHSTVETFPSVMRRYIRSLAGYCVITYILGVGDRHMDNILLRKDGCLLHIDFGFMLGRDPKPMPAQMRITKEMVDAMGGSSSEHFTEFRKLVYTAFQHLRRHASLFLNLFSLMVESTITDIALEPDKAVKKLEYRFLLHLNDERAVQKVQDIMDSSLRALLPAVVEQFHKFAQFIRK